MQEITPSDWAETSTTERVNGTRPHTLITNTSGRNSNLYNTFYQLQHVNKEMKDVIFGELQIGISRILRQASGPLNKIMKLEQSEVRASQLSHMYSIIFWNKHEFQSPNNAHTNLLRWTNVMKVTKSTRAFW